MQQQSNPDEHFNPRLREGGDIFSVSVFVINYLFQSTPPRRRRLGRALAELDR